jgi:hypothetical protein
MVSEAVIELEDALDIGYARVFGWRDKNQRIFKQDSTVKCSPSRQTPKY